MTVTIPDVAFLTCCYPYGQSVRLIEEVGDFKFEKKQRIKIVIEAHLSKDSTDWGKEEEYQFMVWWLSRYIYCSRSKQSLKYMASMANSLVKAKEPVAMASFLLSLVYRAQFEVVTIDLKNPGGLPSRPTLGPLWITATWAHLYFPHLHNFELPSDKDPSAFCGLSIIHFFPSENWERDTASGCLHRLLHTEKPCWRPFPQNDKMYELRQYLESHHFRDHALTPRDLVASDTRGFFVEVYNPQFVVRQQGFAQSSPFPFIDSFNMDLEGHISIDFNYDSSVSVDLRFEDDSTELSRRPRKTKPTPIRDETLLNEDDAVEADPQNVTDKEALPSSKEIEVVTW
ncbi:hypothetical protein MLD38_018775 [Melastoma candidum]|uniref:Uncharacterized protein n=1 Tax=Melastoma candidum TaxID=119954 RepID=A0ACB9QWS2_9MYRT|nr:hypothetical protein MLD38_018775 [Melastoma candidum]